MSKVRVTFLSVGLSAIVAAALGCEADKLPPPPNISASPSADPGGMDPVMRRALDRAAGARKFLDGAKDDMKRSDGGAPQSSAPRGDGSAPN